jgi:hypothetical protein
VTPKTSEFLVSLAGESFKREVDLDESVWRSLPFFAAAFGLAITLLGYVATAISIPNLRFGVVVADIAFGLSLVAFAWAFRWFWTVVKPMEYQYPPRDLDLLNYAEALKIFHEQSGLSGDNLDAMVADEMRLFMAKQLAAATGKNRGNNAIKVLARSQAILFLMVGFALAIVSEATIFLDTRLHAMEVQGDKGNGAQEVEAIAPGQTQTTSSSQAPDRRRGGKPNQSLLSTAQAGERRVTDPKAPAQSTEPKEPVRPEPPEPQLLKKSEDRPKEQR